CQRLKVSCKANAAEDDNIKSLETLKTSHNVVHRRKTLLGLGGLYGLTSIPSSALAYPITAPDNISDCVAATDGVLGPESALRGIACCPPSSAAKPKAYMLPDFHELRVRPAAQRVTPEYIAKYQQAMAAMKALPDDHPHRMVHCAYCNGSYNQGMNNHPELKIQVHNNWLFYPFHRWYLYFYERILGKLINDPTFALPYWNWDNPTGMMIPAMFEAPGTNNDPRANPLFDPYRNVVHLPPAILDLQFRGIESGASCIDQVSVNLSTMFNQMVTSATDTDSFFGTDPNAPNPIVGTIERGAHISMHAWVGNPRLPNREDMGNFYSAGYDPLFYSHHSNVDRMWKIWKDLNSKGHLEPTSQDWLNASYVFYDENEELVRVYNKDCVDINKMGYDYERTALPWIQSRPTPRVKGSNVVAKSIGTVKKVKDVKFPLKLDKTVKVLVKRPATNRTKADKEKANEMLFLNGITFNSEMFLKFDVLVNDVDDGIETTAASSEFAGTFSQVPHKHGDKMLMTSGAAFGITELLEDMEAEGDEYLLVTLVPQSGTDDATVSEIKIQLVPII
ncbi:hypothetical protein M8C21_026987, partial [Ambrosia artemisiifolia]